MKKSKDKAAVKAKAPVKTETNDANPVNDIFAQFLQMIPDNKEFLFQAFDMFPFPMEVFAPDGMSVFLNKAAIKLDHITDPYQVIGKYNLLTDPVCNDEMGLRDGIQRAFRGESHVWYDIITPIWDLVKRDAVEEQPYEKVFADWYLFPVMKDKKVVFVVFVFVVKHLYLGRSDVAMAKEYIDTNWQKEYDAEAVARHVNMGVTHLYKLFKEHTGMTPGDYHKKVKVERIKEKLADKNLAIKEAFAACGENSRGWMSKVFKKTTGMSPLAYRDSLK